MKVLITGARGYIGSFLGNYLLDKGYNVFLASRSNENVQHIPSKIFRRVSWNDQDSLNEICSDIDAIIHAAGMNRDDSANNPFDAFMFNGAATGNLIKAAVNNGVNKFIYLSSYHVYANPLNGEISESTCPCNVHPYATTHRVGEAALYSAVQQGIIDGTILRMSNGFGAPIIPEIDCWGLFVNNLCRHAIEKRHLIIRSNCFELRNFIPIREICNVINLLIEKPILKQETGYNFINVGSINSMSLLEMATLIKNRCLRTLGFAPTIINDQKKDFSRFSLNIDKLYSLGYRQKVSIEEEIDDLLDFCQKNFALS